MSPLSYLVAFSPSCAHGGDDGNRTHDPLLAGQVLSQLSYTPVYGTQAVPLRGVGADLFSRDVSVEVFSALHSLTSVFGMGTGGPCALVAPTTISTQSLKIEQQIYLNPISVRSMPFGHLPRSP